MAGAERNVISLLREQMKGLHELLEGTVADVTTEQAQRKYAQAVYAASDDFLASLRGKDLDRPVDLSALGLGKSTMLFVIHNGILGNGFTHCGEIACLKGLQGKKGYPF